MESWTVLLFATGILSGLVTFWAARRVRLYLRELAHERAASEFPWRREYLEAKFVDLIDQYGRSRGLSYVDSEWDREVVFIRNRRSGQLAALIAVRLIFDHDGESDFESLAARRRLAQATAVFQYQGRRWRTEGRIIPEMNPREALRNLRDQYEMVSA